MSEKISFTTSISQPFWNSINILLTKPNVINKRIWGSQNWTEVFCKSKSQIWNLPSRMKRVDHILSQDYLEKYIQNILQESELEVCDVKLENSQIKIIVSELFPRNYNDNQMLQLVIIQLDKSSVTFYDITNENCKQTLFPTFSYSLQLVENKVVLKSDDKVSTSYMWLKNTLLPQIVKWNEESCNSSSKQNICKESLSFVPQHKYYAKYNELKLKYGKEMVKIWPECTDPSKFVYEDVAIATYLLLLWEEEEIILTKKYTFVDLGCGNGLLVYILAKEGYTGVGIDVRKRNIWDLYPKEVNLQEKTIVPSDSSLFPDTDWVIGNHSDELTPWIPVIAAKSSYECNFFLLPCCAYNFDGTKYQRKDSSKSQYTDYLAHIKSLCIDCGFKTDMDRLKIPSTKRICLVSKGRVYSKDQYDDYDNKIKGIITQNSSSAVNENDPSWVKGFKAREAVERVRNCTQMNKDLISSIVKCIANYLLDGFDKVSDWYAGKTVELREVIQLIPQSQLKQLKSECGGIQTLLKNNHNIFKVQSGKVQLRYPKTVEETNRGKDANIKIKQKPCWFYNNHPQGCPLADSNCSFLHINKL